MASSRPAADNERWRPSTPTPAEYCEFQLLRFLLDHPHRYFTASQILGGAWAEPSLSRRSADDIRRLRKLLAALDVPADIINRPKQGCSLIFRSNT